MGCRAVGAGLDRRQLWESLGKGLDIVPTNHPIVSWFQCFSESFLVRPVHNHTHQIGWFYLGHLFLLTPPIIFYFKVSPHILDHVNHILGHVVSYTQIPKRRSRHLHIFRDFHHFRCLLKKGQPQSAGFPDKTEHSGKCVDNMSHVV